MNQDTDRYFIKNDRRGWRAATEAVFWNFVKDIEVGSQNPPNGFWLFDGIQGQEKVEGCLIKIPLDQLPRIVDDELRALIEIPIAA